MVRCKICGKDLGRITYFHLKQHGMTISEYKKQFPGEPISDLQVKRKIEKEFTSTIHIREKDGSVFTLHVDEYTSKRFKKYRELKGWTVTDAINTLIDHDIAYERLKEKQRKKRKKPSTTKINLAKAHREELEEILKVLEQRVKEERDVAKMAAIAEKIARINAILPELEKSFKSSIDEQIEKLIIKRKAICKNYLPEKDAYPYHAK